MAKRSELETAEAKDDRRQRILASKRAWADRNRDYVRAQNREIAMLPQNVLKRKEKYYQERAKLFALGYVPQLGRPPLHFDSKEDRLAHERELCQRRQETYRRRKAAAALPAPFCSK